MIEVFADLNARDRRGLYEALVEDADGAVAVGDLIRVLDDEGSTYLGHVVEVEDRVIYFSLEPGVRRAPTPSGAVSVVHE